MSADLDKDQVFRIGKVSELTDIKVETLRAWQHRYNFQPAELHGRIRYYSPRQVEQLKKIRQLQDFGKSISSVIHLSNQELDDLLHESIDVSGDTSATLVGIDVIRLLDRTTPEGITVLDRIASVERFEEQLDHFNEPDVVVLELSSLDTERVEVIREALDCGLVVLYHFATRNDLDEFEQLAIPHAAISTITSNEVDSLCQLAIATQNHNVVNVDRKFSDEELLHLVQSDIEDAVSASAVVEIVLAQRAYIDHLKRTTSDAFGIELVATIEVAHAHMESALQRIADEQELIALDGDASTSPQQTSGQK